jgi:hypothetical protein
MDLPQHQPLRFQLPQLLREHLLRDAGDQPLQLREAAHLAAKQLEQDDELPSSFQEPQGHFDVDRRGQGRVRLTGR